MSTESEPLVQAAVKLTRGQLLDLLLEIEDRLKQLIRAVFSGERHDWEMLIPKTIREDLDERRTRPSPRMAGSTSGRSDLLDYADLSQLIDTIRNQWKRFEPLLSHRVALSAKLDEFRFWRNDLAHGVQPTPDEKARIVLLASDLGHAIPAPTRSRTGASDVQLPTGHALMGCRILWADDHPENNLLLRGWLVELGATVIPVLTNDEAISEAERADFHLAVSDIGRDDHGQPGSVIGVRLRAAGIQIPIVFFVGRVDPDLPLPVGGVAVTNDPAELLYHVLRILRGH